MKIEIDTSRISYWVRALSNLQKGDFREELRRAGKLLSNDIINITPPPHKREEARKPKLAKSAKMQLSATFAKSF